MSKHTWKVNVAISARDTAVVYCDGQVVATCGPSPHEIACANLAQNDRADRIAACVNALAGIADPAKFVAAFEAMLSALQQVPKMLGHKHWDYTMRHGAGCEKCIEQGEVMDQVRAAKEKALAAIADAEAKPEQDQTQ